MQPVTTRDNPVPVRDGDVSLPVQRSTRWAEERDSVVVEDDYDTVFRYDKRQIGALTGAVAGMCGTRGLCEQDAGPRAASRLARQPARTPGGARTAKRDDDFGTSALEQQVLARLMDTGEYDRHVRRLRKHYHRRRDSIVDGIGRVMPDAVAEGYAAGLHLLLRLPKNVDEDAFVAAAAARGVAVLGTSPMYGTKPPQPGVVIAYGRTSPAMLEEAARRLGVAVAEAGKATLLTRSPRAERSTEVRRPSTAVDYF